MGINLGYPISQVLLGHDVSRRRLAVTLSSDIYDGIDIDADADAAAAVVPSVLLESCKLTDVNERARELIILSSPGPNTKFFVDIVVNIPVLQIINMFIGLCTLALEWPLPFVSFFSPLPLLCQYSSATCG